MSPFCCTSLPWKSTATALYLMPALIPVWSYQPFFDHVNRWVSFGAWTQRRRIRQPPSHTNSSRVNRCSPRSK